jgi:hypothetical protein
LEISFYATHWKFRDILSKRSNSNSKTQNFTGTGTMNQRKILESLHIAGTLGLRAFHVPRLGRLLKTLPICPIINSTIQRSLPNLGGDNARAAINERLEHKFPFPSTK